jgi:hypothetical protein
MVPIIKNIRVVDEQGNEYEATYPKRAKGLIKNGRARFINENVICLACPPDKINDNIYLEDNKMNNDNINVNDNFDYDKYIQATNNPIENTWEYALKQIEKISNGTKELRDLIGEAAELESDSVMGLTCAIQAREETNQKLIEFYQKMYEDLKPNNKQPNSLKTADVLTELIKRKIETIELDSDMDDFENDIKHLGEILNYVNSL